MIRKLGPLWLDLADVVIYEREEFRSVTIMTTDGRRVMLEGAEYEAFMAALPGAVEAESALWMTPLSAHSEAQQ